MLLHCLRIHSCLQMMGLRAEQEHAELKVVRAAGFPLHVSAPKPQLMGDNGGTIS